MKIKFSKPYKTGNELKYIEDILKNHASSAGDGMYTKKVHTYFETKYGVHKALLTTSCTSALEFAIRLCNLKPGDEVIVPSFTFSSTVNAILLARGLKVIFAEVDKATLNIDPTDIEKKITKKTKAIMVVHYAGVACDMDRIMTLAKQFKLKVIEDAAQGIEAKYKGRYLGTIGDFGCVSFHDTKNITCGEGGALFINADDKKIVEEAEIIRDAGTTRSKFFRGIVDQYTWVDIGSSYLPSDILAAYLYAQLEQAEKITKMRMDLYNFYKEILTPYERLGLITLPSIPDYATHNAHIFYIIFNDHASRNFVLDYCQAHGVGATFHYIPLHSAPQGKKLGYKKSDLPITETQAGRLIRLPLYVGMSQKERTMIKQVLLSALDTLYIDTIGDHPDDMSKVTQSKHRNLPRWYSFIHNVNFSFRGAAI